MNCIYSISSPDYIAYAKNVADTFLSHNPDFTYHVFVTERNAGIDDDFGDSRVVIHYADELGITQLPGMKSRYTIFEYANSLKAFMGKWLLDNFPVKNLLYTDTDMMFFGKVSAIEELLKKNSIILTPHIIRPIALDGKGYAENGFLNAGLYNAGFFAIRNSETSHAFLQWWMERVETLCKVDFENGLFADQIWLNLVPIFFSEVHVLRDPSYNMGAWNLTERKFTNNQYLINGSSPLVCYHFGGFDVTKPDELCKYQNRFSFDDRTELIPLYKSYLDRLVKFGLSSSKLAGKEDKRIWYKNISILNRLKLVIKKLVR